MINTGFRSLRILYLCYKKIAMICRKICVSGYQSWLFALFLMIACTQANADILNFYSWTFSDFPGDHYCQSSSITGSVYYEHQVAITITPNAGCTYGSSLYPPHSGNFKVRVKELPMGQYVDSSYFYLDASKSFEEQSVTMSGGSRTVYDSSRDTIAVCYYLLDESGATYLLSGRGADGCSGSPLPPDPPDTSCEINNGSDLSVSLGQSVRSELPTVPDSGSAKAVQIPVECAGGDVSFAMKLKYNNPIIIGSSQAVSTTTNGVGVAIIYENEPIATTDSKNITFLKGSNTLTLYFQAVRDPGVEVKDIATGTFTANAILEMTQQ
ncbi:fimbrial protein [Atlantibacter sp. RC6]|uniref:fimbrial protein n=1 Tax=Atlantibacter sp. RC6 TaxID=2587036 RepID=UPI00160589A8|nr:fimbrial protein [Atlantibacter sp. RC6]MBB3320759.1 type 1 fimbria pilin [Atlantibacter sp. RC6]